MKTSVFKGFFSQADNKYHYIGVFHKIGTKFPAGI